MTKKSANDLLLEILDKVETLIADQATLRADVDALKKRLDDDETFEISASVEDRVNKLQVVPMDGKEILGRDAEALMAEVICHSDNGQHGASCLKVRESLKISEKRYQQAKKALIKRELVFQPRGRGNLYVMRGGQALGYSEPTPVNPVRVEELKEAVMTLPEFHDMQSSKLANLLRAAGHHFGEEYVPIVLNELCEEGRISKVPNPARADSAFYSRVPTRASRRKPITARNMVADPKGLIN